MVRIGRMEIDRRPRTTNATWYNQVNKLYKIRHVSVSVPWSILCISIGVVIRTIVEMLTFVSPRKGIYQFSVQMWNIVTFVSIKWLILPTQKPKTSHRIYRCELEMRWSEIFVSTRAVHPFSFHFEFVDSLRQKTQFFELVHFQYSSPIINWSKES